MKKDEHKVIEEQKTEEFQIKNNSSNKHSETVCKMTDISLATMVVNNIPKVDAEKEKPSICMQEKHVPNNHQSLLTNTGNDSLVSVDVVPVAPPRRKKKQAKTKVSGSK